MKGHPPELQSELKDLMGPMTEIGYFMEQFVRYRASHLQARRDPRVREVKQTLERKMVEEAAANPPLVQNPYEEVSASLLAELGKGQEALVRAIENMKRDMTTTSYRAKKPWCGYCVAGSNGHWARECPKNPPRGSCFSCLGMGHRKGATICPNQQP